MRVLAKPEAKPNAQPDREIDPDRRPGYLIKKVSMTMRTRMDAVLRPHGLTAPQFICLQLLHDTPRISGAELARKAFVSRQSIHQMLGDLRARGLVEQEPSTHGRRRGVARLTEEGRRHFEAALPDIDAFERATFAALEDGEREQLVDILRRCEAALEDLE